MNKSRNVKQTSGVAELNVITILCLFSMSKSVFSKRFYSKCSPNLCQGVSCLLTQSPFILDESIESNILFGLPMERAKYQRVVDACALPHDFKLLKDGDQTRAGIKVRKNG